jgi:hypothetical protein
MLFYGVDQVAISLLFILCLAPIGRALSVDHLLALRAVRRPGSALPLLLEPGPWAAACARLVQLQMAIVFLFSGFTKLGGKEWLQGRALWSVFSRNEMYNGPILDLLARFPLVDSAATYAVLAIELVYPALIWPQRTRPYLLVAALLLHLQIGLWMGMPYFACVMSLGHLSFLPWPWLRGLSLVRDPRLRMARHRDRQPSMS